MYLRFAQPTIKVHFHLSTFTIGIASILQLRGMYKCIHPCKYCTSKCTCTCTVNSKRSKYKYTYSYKWVKGESPFQMSIPTFTHLSLTYHRKMAIPKNKYHKFYM